MQEKIVGGTNDSRHNNNEKDDSKNSHKPATTTTAAAATASFSSMFIQRLKEKAKKKKKKRISPYVILISLGLLFSVAHFVWSVQKSHAVYNPSSLNEMKRHFLDLSSSFATSSFSVMSSDNNNSEKMEDISTIPMSYTPPLPSLSLDHGAATGPSKSALSLVLVWKHLMQGWNIHSVLELNAQHCGYATAFFQTHGMTGRAAKCVVPFSSSSSSLSLWNPDWQVTHDYHRGPWWPYNQTFDVAWMMMTTQEDIDNGDKNNDHPWDLLVSEDDDSLTNFYENVVPTFRTAAIIILVFRHNDNNNDTSQTTLNDKMRIVAKTMQRLGFKPNAMLTNDIQNRILLFDDDDDDDTKTTTSTTKKNSAQVITIQVYLNPLVAALPQHAHLFFEHGCFQGRRTAKEQERMSHLSPIINRPCRQTNGETELPPDFSTPRPLTPDMDLVWIQTFLLQRGGEEGTNQISDRTIATIMTSLASNNATTTIYAKNPGAAASTTPRFVSQNYQNNYVVLQNGTYILKWELPNPEPDVPAEFTSNKDAFWDLMYKNANNSAPLPRIWTRRLLRQPKSSRQYPQNEQENDVVNITTIPVIPVVHWPSVYVGHQTAEHRHIFLNGLEESHFLKNVNNISYYDDPNLVWIGDPGFGWRWETWCHEFAKVVKKAQVERYKLGLSTRWPIFIPDFTDGWGKQRCLEVEKLIGLDLIVYMARAIVGGRRWSESHQWIKFGRVVKDFPYVHEITPEVQKQVQYRHIALVARTDTVQGVQDVLRESFGNIKLSDPIEELPRPMDLLYMWPLELPTVGVSPVGRRDSRFRTKVGNLLKQYADELGWNASIGLVGLAGKVGRHKVDENFIKSMLNSKIVMVVQRDTYEDHYRLMEALVSGALVITDYMAGLPGGLKNGTSVLMFKTPGELKSLISYYLEHKDEREAIAKRGRFVAMSQHRSWHRMEEIVFGEILTTCDYLTAKNTLFPDDTCPYMVHTRMDFTTADKHPSASRNRAKNQGDSNQPHTASKTLPTTLSNAERLRRQRSRPKVPRPWEVPLDHPTVPEGFTNKSFWNMIQDRAKQPWLAPKNQTVPQIGTVRKITKPIPVFHWPFPITGQQTAEHRHVFKDGIEQSNYMTLVQNTSYHGDPDWVWIGDPGFGWSWYNWCHEFTQAVKAAIIERYNLGLPLRWPVHIADFTDGEGKQRCIELERIMGLDLVFYSARCIVSARNFDNDTGWIAFGHIPKDFPTSRDLKSVIPTENISYRHIPLVVRTDTVRELEKVLQEKSMALSDSIEKLPRAVDVSHLWPLYIPEGMSAPVNKQYARLRSVVSKLLDQHGKEMGWNTFIGLSGDALRPGRQGVKRSYINTLLETKIIVVTGRDMWEDHYRLMEALVTGAMVLSDKMLAPPQGLENGTSIVFFSTRENLISLITYYLAHENERLAIARQGRKVAFSQHRSWHRAEEIVFGERLSTCEDSVDDACPYTVDNSVPALKRRRRKL